MTSREILQTIFRKADWVYLAMWVSMKMKTSKDGTFNGEGFGNCRPVYDGKGTRTLLKFHTGCLWTP